MKARNLALLEPIDAGAALPEPFARWFAQRGWRPRAHQLELLAKARSGRAVLLIAPTGGGKTLAGFLPTLAELSQSAAMQRDSLPRLRGRVGVGTARK
jgi:ATP-dependent helicase Lhr and Lhr-like helicase